MTDEDLERLLDQRGWLIDLVVTAGCEVTDSGFPPAEFVYEDGGHRYEVQIREMEP